MKIDKNMIELSGICDGLDIPNLEEGWGWHGTFTKSAHYLCGKGYGPICGHKMVIWFNFTKLFHKQRKCRLCLRILRQNQNVINHKLSDAIYQAEDMYHRIESVEND